jgi:transcriptional regulator with XRE-family HTH domain
MGGCKHLSGGTQLLARKLSSNDEDVLTPQQLRAGRALAGWSRHELAKRSGTNLETIKNFESGTSDPKLSTLHKWRRALASANVEFLDPDPFSPGSGPGVRLRDMPKGKR